MEDSVSLAPACGPIIHHAQRERKAPTVGSTPRAAHRAIARVPRRTEPSKRWMKGRSALRPVVALLHGIVRFLLPTPFGRGDGIHIFASVVDAGIGDVSRAAFGQNGAVAFPVSPTCPIRPATPTHGLSDPLPARPPWPPCPHLRPSWPAAAAQSSRAAPASPPAARPSSATCTTPSRALALSLLSLIRRRRPCPWHHALTTPSVSRALGHRTEPPTRTHRPEDDPSPPAAFLDGGLCGVRSRPWELDRNCMGGGCDPAMVRRGTQGVGMWACFCAALDDVEPTELQSGMRRRQE